MIIPAATDSDLVVNLPADGTGWASQVIRAFATHAISAATMWELLFSNADRPEADAGTAVTNLLAHLRDAYEERHLVLETHLSATDDDFVVMPGEDDAA